MNATSVVWRARRWSDAARCRPLVALLVSMLGWVYGLGIARADQASGTWTGELESHGSYYLERSTKVLVPTGRVSLEAPNGVRVGVSYLADVITSASLASGTTVDAAHVEVRQAVGTSVGKVFALGDNELDLTAYGTHSWESDYISWLYGARLGYLFNQKNTGLSLGVTGVNDTIYANMGADRVYAGDLDGITFSFGFSQLLSPVLTFAAGYQLVYLTGFLGNPYRAAKLGPLRHPENPPEGRLRHNVEATVGWYLPPTQTTLQLFARVYTDSWDLAALTPELRAYQALGRDLYLRLRFRYYAQSSVHFASAGEVGIYPQGYSEPYYTQDPKLTGFHSLQTGIRLSYALNAFESSILDFVSHGVLDLSFDYQWTTIKSGSFGNRNVFLILGGRLPF